MSLQQIGVIGLKSSSRVSILKHFSLLTAQSKLLFGQNIRSYSSLSLLSVGHVSKSSDISTTPRPISPLHHTGLTSQTGVTVLSRDYSTVNSSGSISNGYLVYRGRVHRMFRGLKIFSLTTSAFGLLLQPYLWYSLQDLSLVATVPLFTVVNLFVFTNPFLIHFLSKRYVNELYFNPKTKQFTATVLTFFARKETILFTADDVRVPDIPGMFSMLTVKDRPLFIDERDFASMEVYKHMMGFDRPLDLRHTSNPSREDSGQLD